MHIKIYFTGKKFLFFFIVVCIGEFYSGNAENRWNIQPDGSTKWIVNDCIPHYDHIEMSGEYLSAILRYGVKPDYSFRLERTVVWPMLRTLPNDTHASLTKRFAFDFISSLVVNGQSLKNEKVESLSLNGCLTVVSNYFLSYTQQESSRPSIQVTRTFFPSINTPVWCEQYHVRNLADKPVEIMVPDFRNVYHTAPEKGQNGSYTITVILHNTGTYTIQPGKQISFDASIQAFSKEKKETELVADVSRELRQRQDFIDEMWNNLVLETPDETINRAFAFAKIRASESIYRTAGGLMHGPGGEAYYAAIWANDESEYVAPFSPFLGYMTANKATLNTFRLYMPYMNNKYIPVPSSIIAEGTDTWQGAGDCGDAAMLAYGGLRYALARGSIEEANYIWPLMKWSLEYCNRRLNNEGVVESDSDELEGRFPSGNANLLVSSLYYDALISADYIGKEIGLSSKQRSAYQKQAKALKKSIENYFGAEVEGYHTYAYYKGNTSLRSWICAPLFAGIYDRGKETIEALFSNLWTKEGLLSETGSKSFWDRSTLSALRAGFEVGETEKMVKYLAELSNRRLLEDHVPYPIEAWPEGNQRHLSGESALYCRIITEGLFGIRPSGLNSFILTPRLPEKWEKMSLKNIHGFGGLFDIEVCRKNKKVEVQLKTSGKIIFKKKVHENTPVKIKIH
ncbi:MAG: hypothetical protein PHG27_01875 [Massilibacteroides sp.]|nr:hypothetical protein [Massilibacteroides sp.]MDD3061702.1 hypothetical protein [Massilibacteroides sp.]MDD4114335.1 hypothetical protein [Massilibacteroides sp.]MDD4660253.1 hypothetical protein [Massilibacteroides sp.]